MDSVKQTRIILADFDSDAIVVYQAYSDTIANGALRDGTFSDGFSLERMTWIKPSFGWMLYRAGYGQKPGQERIMRIRIDRRGFEEILADATLSHFDPRFYEDESSWNERLNRTQNRVQWDPDRNLRLGRMDRRAIQIGVHGRFVKAYVNEWIRNIEEVTPLARKICEVAKDRSASFPLVPEEREYPVPKSLRAAIGME